MSESEHIYSQIAQYLAGEMSSSEKGAFAQRIASDPTLQNKVTAYEATERLVLENRLLSVKELALDVHQTSTKGTKWNKYLLASAVIAILGTAAYFGLNKIETQPTQTSKDLRPNAPTLMAKKSTEVVATPKEITPSSKGKTSVAPQKEASKLIVTEQAQTTEQPRENLTAQSLPIPTINEVAVSEEKTIAPQVQEKAPETVNICAHTHLKANVFAHPSCTQEHNGSIAVSSIHGGKAPYKISLLHNKQELALSEKLEAGTYLVVLTDANHCSTQISNIKVPIKDCRQAYHFNPFVGESWEIPVYDQDGTLTVYDKAGNVYFHEEIPSGSHAKWSGQPNSGDMTAGHFLFTIQYRDGSVKQGSISIVR